MGAAIVALLSVTLAGAVARAQTPAGYAVNARLEPRTGVIEAAMHVAVDVGRGEDTIRLWLYADRLAVAPTEMDELSARWIYPGEVDEGGIEVRDVRVDGRPVETRRVEREPGTARGRDTAGSDLVVSVQPGAARRVELRLRFRLRVPRRFGRLGRVGDRVHLAGPWYPLVVEPDAGGPAVDAWAYRVPHRVRLELTRPRDVVLGRTLLRERGGEVRTEGPWVPAVVAPRLHVRERRVQGARLRWISADAPYEPPPPDAEGLERLEDLARVDMVGRTADVVEQALATLRAVRWPDRPEEVDVIVVPSRTELAAVAPGWVLASDRLFQIFPLDITRALHDRALRRAVLRSCVADGTARRDPPADRPWASDLRAALLNDLDAARREREVQTTRDLIGWAGFHPAVDQLLYAPQIAFVDVYFGTVDEPDPFRDEPARSRSPRSSGRRILEMARDALEAMEGETEPTRFTQLASAVLASDPADAPSVRDALEAVAPGMAQRLPVWLAAPALEVNYRLGAIDSRRLDDGRWRHRVQIVREGARRPEPVTVQVEDENGNVDRATWEGARQRGTVELVTAAPLEDVRLDPEHRLVQSPGLADGHPRHDDATRQPWKPPILRAFGLSASASEGTVDAFVDFAMRRKYDLDNTVAFQLDHDARSYGLGLRYVRGVGRKRHTNARIGSVSTGLDLDRIKEGFVGEGEGGVRASVGLGAGVDTHTFFVDPRTGQALSGSMRAGIVRQDDGDLSWAVSTGLRGHVTVPFGLRNALVLVAGSSWIFGDPIPGERPGLGGQFLLRGFESDELVGDGTVYGVVEHRWTALSDLALDAVHLAWVREIQLAVFAGGGAVFDPLGMDTAVEPAAEVGGGVRVHFDYAGVQPGVLAIDAGVPLTRGRQAREERPPVGLHLGFSQFF